MTRRVRDPVTDDAEACLKEREALAWARLQSAALGLKDALIVAGNRAVGEHPWTLPSVGFCAGFLLPFLLCDRRPASDARNDSENGREHAR